MPAARQTGEDVSGLSERKPRETRQLPPAMKAVLKRSLHTIPTAVDPLPGGGAAMTPPCAIGNLGTGWWEPVGAAVRITPVLCAVALIFQYLAFVASMADRTRTSQAANRT